MHWIYNILTFEKIKLTLLIDKQEFKDCLKYISNSEFKDNNPFTKQKTAFYSCTINDDKIKISRIVSYMNFMRPMIKGKFINVDDKIILEIFIIPFGPGIAFLIGLVIAWIAIFLKSVDFTEFHSILSGFLFATFFTFFGYIGALVAFKIESIKIKEDLNNFLNDNKLIDNIHNRQQRI